MHASRNQRCVSSNPGRAALRWLGLSLLAVLLTACGGGADYDNTPAPPGGSAAPTVAFKLLPARVGLTTGGASKLLALQSPGALTWSSSAPAVASVDSEGLVTALGSGSAVISATSGTSVASASVTVFATTDATGSALIATALAQNRISAEQALMYRVFAMFGDPRLPAEFAGAPDGAPDHMLLRQVSGALPTLSQAGRDTLVPFLLPPIYAESWFAQQLGLPAASATSGKAQAAAAKGKRPNATAVNCEAATLTRFWRTLATAHFNIHYIALGSDEFYDAYHRKGAETIAAVVEEVYSAETDLLGRFPLADTSEACNGGDGALDIYLTHLGSSDTRGATTTYPDRCNKVPSFIAINAGDPAIAAASSGFGDARRETKAIVAHEFAHVLQFAMDRPGNAFGCDEYEWLDEATAEWAMDFVDATWNREDGANPTNGNYRRSGSFYSQYLYSDHMNSIEKPGLAGDPKKNGYADYIFFQYLARKYDPQTIKQVFDATTARTSVEAVEAALASKGGMKTVWPEFALTLWNDAANQNLDDLSRWDGYDFGLAPVFERRAGVPPAHLEAGKLKSIDVEQRGQGRESFKMLQNALDRPGGVTASDFYEIQPRSIFYEHLRFSDPTVHSVYFSNPIGIIPNHRQMKVQARKKIAGKWQDVEDWTDQPFMQFCLDKKAERLEELLIIVSNSEVNRGNEQPFRYPKLFPMLTSTSNVGCFKWQGSASTAATGGTPISVDSLASAVNVVMVPVSVLPGRLVFGTEIGTAGARAVVTAATCTTTLDGATRDFNPPSMGVPPPTNDGTIDFNLDLEMGFGEVGGEAPNRKLITLTGSSILTTTSTLVCPPVTQTSVGAQSWEWLHVDDPGQFSVSADGQSIEGRFTGVLPSGATMNTIWKFKSLRE